MIEKNTNINNIQKLINEYKDNYIVKLNEFTNVYTYKENDNYVSFVIFDIIYDRCEIIDIFTKKEYQNMGYASALINEIIKDYKIDNITLEVNSLNNSAIKLYEKLGFHKASIRKGYYNGVDGILMIKEVR